MASQNNISLDKELIFAKISEGDFSYCIELLRKEFKLSRNADNALKTKYPSEDTLNVLGEILSKSASEFPQDNDFKQALLLTKQCFQSLRNCAVNGQEVQNSITNHADIMETSYILFGSFLNKNDADYLECLNMELQFLCNLTVSNANSQMFVWSKYYELLKTALIRSEVAHVVTMIIYNILKQHYTLIPTDVAFISGVLTMHSKCIENVSLLLELLVDRNIFTNIYNELDSNNIIVLLDTVHLLLMEDKTVLPYDLINTLSEQFKRKSDCILKTVEDYVEDIEPLEVARLLDCLASASGKDQYLSKMQGDRSLLINCAYLLQSVHDLGKYGHNHFSSLQKLIDVETAGTSGIQAHPIFGFKAALIRLIGNLCWKHKNHQKLVRDLECIPVLLDSCKMDARNPLIMQWAILAIRNLCEDNAENQAIIAQLVKVGVVDSALLHEMGLTLQDGGDKICIVPLNLNK